MNIIYTGPFRFPTGDAAAARVLNNGKLLRLLGYNVTYISWGGCSHEAEKQDDNGHFYYDGFRFIITNDIDVKKGPIKRLFNFLFSGKKALRHIKSLIQNVDLIIAYNPPIYFTLRLNSLCKKYNLPFISDITEWYAPNEFPGGIFAPPVWLNEINMRIVQKKVKNKIVISSFLNKYYSESNNILLPPLVDHDEAKWNFIDSVLPIFDGIRILYAGTPAKKDLLETILNAVISSVNSGLKIQFVMVGVLKEEISSYSNYQNVLSYPDNILFCGRVSQTKVPSYFKISDFSIIIRKPTRKNMAGFPTKLVESLMAGCPVITNSTSDISKHIVQSKNGLLVKNWSVNELKNSLEKIADFNSSELLRMKTFTKNYALENFNYTSYLNQGSKFLKNIN